MKLSWTILSVLVVAGFGLFSSLGRSPRGQSLRIGSSREDFDGYVVQKESRGHTRGLPPFWVTLHAGPYGHYRPYSQRNSPDYYDGTMEIYTRFGLRSGHSFAVRQELVELRLNRVVAISKRLIWSGDF